MAGTGALIKVLITLLPYIVRWLASKPYRKVISLYEASKRQKARKPSDRDALRHFFNSVRNRKK